MNTNTVQNEDFEQGPESGEIDASGNDIETSSSGEKRAHKALSLDEIRARFNKHDAIKKKLEVLYTQARELETELSTVVEDIYYGASRGKRWVRNGQALTASKRGNNYFFREQAQEDIEQV